MSLAGFEAENECAARFRFRAVVAQAGGVLRWPGVDRPFHLAFEVRR
jgi:hypothetical protein